MNAVTIQGVPESITRDQSIQLIASLGIDPNQLLSLTWRYNGIEAEVFAVDKNGERYITDHDTVAMHKVSIPILDEDDD